MHPTNNLLRLNWGASIRYPHYDPISTFIFPIHTYLYTPCLATPAPSHNTFCVCLCVCVCVCVCVCSVYERRSEKLNTSWIPTNQNRTYFILGLLFDFLHMPCEHTNHVVARIRVTSKACRDNHIMQHTNSAPYYITSSIIMFILIQV